MPRKRGHKNRADAPKQTFHKKGNRPKRKKDAAAQPLEASAASVGTQEQEEDCITEMTQEENKQDTSQIPPDTTQKSSDDQAASKGPDGETGKPDALNVMRHRGIDAQTQTDSVLQTTQETQTEELTTETAVRTRERTEPGTAAASEEKEPSPPETEQRRKGSLKRERGANGKETDKVSEKEKKQETSEKDNDKVSERTNQQETSENQDRDVERMDTDDDVHLGSSTDPPAGRQSYAQVAAEKIKGKETESKQTRKPSPVRAPPGIPVFTFHMYAVLDRQFGFNRDHNTLLLLTEQETFSLIVVDCIDLGKGGTLVEATWLVDARLLNKGVVFTYKYGIQKHRKQIEEMALRSIQIPFEGNELHLYEGHINPCWTIRDWFTSWVKSAEKTISKTWDASARELLNLIFQKWEPSSEETIRKFTQHLRSYQMDFISACQRISYPGGFYPPEVKASEMIGSRLVQLLFGETEGKSENKPLQNKHNLLLQAFAVFQVCNACRVDLDTKSWGRLCELVSSQALESKHVDDMKAAFSASANLVGGLMNNCINKMVPEVVLLVPLLQTLRQPGADSRRLGPIVEEQNWAGLEYIEYSSFRQRLRNFPVQRRFMMQLLDDHKSVAQERPHILISWISMVALEDIPEFVTRTKIAPKYVIQGLMYRLRQYEQSPDNNTTPRVLKVTEGILSLVLKRVEEEKESGFEQVACVFQCCSRVHKSTYQMARLSTSYKTAVLSFQLLLKVAEILDILIVKTYEGEEGTKKQTKLIEILENAQRDFGQWRDNLLQNFPLMKNKSLSCPKEMELWDALFGVECSVKGVADQWRSRLERDLRKRISQVQDNDKVALCCLESIVTAMEKTHVTIQTCFKDSCSAAIKSICHNGRDGDLVKYLLSCSSVLPSSILSAIILESSTRFTRDPIGQLLFPHSAISQLLSQGNQTWSLDDEAGAVIQRCRTAFAYLVRGLYQGDIRLGHLETTLKHRDNFKKLYTQARRIQKDEVTFDLEKLLLLRENDLKAFCDQKANMDNLIKMMGKVSEFIVAQEMPTLEQCHRGVDLESTRLNQLVSVQPFNLHKLCEQVASRVVLWYRLEPEVLQMAREMSEVGDSSLLLSYWEEEAKSIISWASSDRPVTLTLSYVCDEVWDPCFNGLRQLGLSIADSSVTFEELNRTLERAGDQGDGAKIQKELVLLERMLVTHEGLQSGWAEQRLPQIQQYRQLQDASESACVIMDIRDSLQLTGDFGQIHCLTQLREASFQQRNLSSLSNELISARQSLSRVTPKHTSSLKALVDSHCLVDWVQNNLKNLSDLKVFVDLASISAGENDTEIDRVANFHDAVMGYSPLLYFMQTTSGFKEFMGCTKQLWDTLERDEKLPEKLLDSNRWLDWLKGLKETHGSVEQSSLSLASDINNHGVYQVQRLQDQNGKTSLHNMLLVSVQNHYGSKTYGLDELLELQNKLMLMSSKRDHGKEHVNRFTQVFEGVQILAGILLQLQSAGNMLFRNCKASVHCNHEEQPCIRLHFYLLQKDVVKEYQGEVTERLQELSRSMESCYKDWCAFLSEIRSQFPTLNHFSSEQLVYLSESIHSICTKRVSVPQKVWHLLAPIKSGCTLSDVKKSLEKATVVESTSAELPDSDLQNIEEISEEGSVDSSVYGSEDELDYSNDESIDSRPSFHPHDEIMDLGTVERLEDLWQSFKEDMSRYLTEQIDLRTLASFLTFLSEMNEHQVKRKLPPGFQEGRPNLVLCPATEVLRTALSVYIQSPDQTLPSTDEVLMCQEDTTEEQVEIFLRRCLTRCAVRNCQKIYSLINPDLLPYDVSVALGEHFEAFDKKAGPHYRLVMVCPVTHQGRYVPSFFSNFKVQAGLSAPADRARRYLSHHLSLPSHLHHLQGVYPDNLSVWIISSERPAVGKSLYITRLFERFKTTFRGGQYIRIRLIEPQVNMSAFLKILTEKLNHLREQDPVLLHIDTAAVQLGLEEFLFQFLILGCLSDNQGNLWRRNAFHLMSVEVLQPHSAFHGQASTKETGLLCTLPTIHCRPPNEVKQLELKIRNKQLQRNLDPLMDDQEFQSEGIQRPYQFLMRFNRNDNLDRFAYAEGSVEGNHIDCLHHLLANCGLKDPSWAELKHFTWFLNLQLRDCESSIFCDADFLADQLPGFKSFIVKFMIRMSQDFASPSLDISDQSPSIISSGDGEVDPLAHLTIRKRWETEPHPYIFFNADHMSMTFLGFNVMQNPRNNILNAIDPVTRSVLVGNVMSPELFAGIERQHISLQEDFEDLPREVKIQRISNVVGAKLGWVKGRFDPDPTYELTADNVKKMLAIHMRFRCGIPVIIMGETGCGKTRLVRFLCDLQREGKNVQNMKLVKVHGGTTAETIYRKVQEAEILAIENQRHHELDTVLFFDEANTTEAIFAIKEVLCDKTVQGVPLRANSGLKIIAACNPYRRHSADMVARLERAGLGYRVKAGETEDRLGKVPLRQLVYRVHPLPPSLIPLVWDFGQLSNLAEQSYIKQIVWNQFQDYDLPLSYQGIISDVLAASQRYMRSRENECSFVSLRDVERSMRVLVWFYQHRDQLFPQCDQRNTALITLKCLALAVGVCYYPSLESKEEYLTTVSRHFPKPLNTQSALEEEILTCQDLFLSEIQTRETIAKNIALKENVFLMVVCIELRIPLFLVGKPGSSKSLAKTVVADAMQGQNSHCEFFQQLKEVHMVSFQCSPHSSPEGIIGTFRNCARFQKEKDMDRYVSVVVLDEIGLAEDSPQMPLKTLHPLLEDGSIDSDESDPHMKVGFVGISNWALDPAKMNRGIFVSRWDPSEKELVETAQGICSSSKAILLKIKHLFPQLAEAFLKMCNETQFFGLRDYYSLVKMLFAIVKKTDNEPSESELAEAILRNFSGQCDGFDPLSYFQNVFQNLKEITRPSTLTMVEKNLDFHNNECRYLLLLTTNNAALHILEQQIFSKSKYPTPEIVFGSGFPKDQEYSQICRNVNRVKTCMETGRTVILLNLQNLYESLYDALNQYYVYLSGQQYVDLGLGSHRVKCRVHKDFRLVVVEDQEKVYKQFPVPLINRLEKHRVNRSTDLTPWQLRVLGKLKEWVEEFCQHSEEFKPSEVFVGFHSDACACALLQALEKRDKLRSEMAQNGEDVKDDVPDESVIEEQTTSDTQRERGDILEAVGDNQQKILDSTGQSDIEMQSLPDQQETSTGEFEGQEQEETHSGMAVEEESSGMDDAVQMDQDTVEEDCSEMTDYKKEEEVFDIAKTFLLNCSTPDSVLRLKYSHLGNQEREDLQQMYFQRQHHCSLRDFINNHLNQPENHCRFIEITTFSSLLTKADVRTIAKALGLTTERLLLLSLHQFDTEASFCSKIRHFLHNAGQSLHILLVQMDTEESKCSEELIASAKYSTMNELIAMGSDEFCCSVVFITKLSRMTGGPQYIGFQGGVWLSVHIDDLRDTEDMSLDLSAFCGASMSELMSLPSPDAMNTEDSSVASMGTGHGKCVHLDNLSLVRSCIQKAVSLLKDTQNSRSMERIRIVLGFLEGSHGKSSAARFQKVLLRRLVDALAQKEELMPNPKDWVSKEAGKRQALQESGTLRHTLWRCLLSTLTPILARILEVLDRDANLDLAYSAGLSEELIDFWLDIFDDKQILDLTFSQTSRGEEEIKVQANLMLGGREQPCRAPFSWLIRSYYHALWEESQFVPGDRQQGSQRIRQFVASASSSKLGGYLGKLSEEGRQEFGLLYLRDFVLLCFKVQSEEGLAILCKAVLGCIFALQQSMSVASELCPAWILAASRHYSSRLDTLFHILQLQPHLAAKILNKDSQREATEMKEDIWALGMCVEETKLQTVTSLEESRAFLQRVQVLKPCVERAFGQNYSALCSAGCLQHLNAIRTVWCGMLVVAAFIEQVVLEVNKKEVRVEALTLKHCSLIHKLMEEAPDLQSKDSLEQLIRILNSYHNESISRDLRFGLICPVCMESLTEPCVLPCKHIVCLRCLQQIVQTAAKRCPACRTDLPADFQPAVSASIKRSLEQHRHMRRCCDSFFLEVVSRFCLCEGESPREEVVELLFSLLISAQGDVYKTRELTPFLECVDQSPVVRSVLPKLLLQHSFQQVKGHIQNYLQNLAENLMSKEDRTELYLLFVNCFQDALRCSAGAVKDREAERKTLQEDMAFLSRLARGQIPTRQQDPAEFLLSLARLRLCLATAASLLQKALGQPQGELGELEQKYLEQVKAVCAYRGNDWYRVYLLRVLNRLAGMDGVLALMNSPPSAWAFPPDVIRLQRLIPADVDRYLCSGQSYRTLRDGVGQALMETRTDALKAVLQAAGGSSAAGLVPLSLAVFRQVTCRLVSPDSNLRPRPQEIKALEDFLKTNVPGDLRDFCTALLSNRVGGPGSPLQLDRGMSARRRTLLELLVHAGSVLHSGNRLLSQLQRIASQPQNMTGAFLPTMPDDNSSQAQQWMATGREQNLKTYKCANGHLSFVGECGKPVAVSKCPECGIPIGGVSHNPVAGFTLATGGVGDQTQPGHILGEARLRSEAPERQMSSVQSCLLRFLTHLAMLLGAAQNQQGVRAMIQHRVHNVIEFLYNHLEKDMKVLGRSLDLNMDDTAIIVHLILSASARDSYQQRADLASRQGRERWEKTVCDSVITPTLQDLNRKLTQAQEAVSADDRLSGSPLMRLLHSDPRPMLPLPSDCPTHHSSFWNVPENLSVERLTQVVEQSHERDSVPLLSLFLKKVPCVRQLGHLLELAALQVDLLRVFPTETDLSSRTITEVLQQIHKGNQKTLLVGRVETFIKVWNCLRMELARDSERGVPKDLCGKALSMESSGAYLSPSRHGPGSCLRVLIDFLSDTHNSLVRETRTLNQDDSDYSITVEGLSKTQLALCHPERELLPLVLAHCHYTLVTGRQTDMSYNLLGIQRELCRRFLAGKPLIQVDTSKYLNRHQQDFSVILADVSRKIPQEPLKGSVLGDMKVVLKSFTDVCDAVFAVEIGLRFLGKTGGGGEPMLVPYLRDSLRMGQQISSNMVKALGENSLQHCVATWQFLTCWKSELMLRKGQDPFQSLPKEFRGKLLEEDRTGLRRFLGLTDVDFFSREVHEILLLKTNPENEESYAPHWDIRSTLENHLDQKGMSPPPELDDLPEELTMAKSAEIWKFTVALV
ncbi:E3 ubiquitin-protein ligase rnf213-beta isoform X3 [Alosa pseudoharengus]|uniref:E3 ubiquitin-protein ligase rnf213-beta isoform X3 n=1 Tax=Alosa pseudoharengus TaxID=34774 RepID=UPI003F89CD3B